MEAASTFSHRNDFVSPPTFKVKATINSLLFCFIRNI